MKRGRGDEPTARFFSSLILAYSLVVQNVRRFVGENIANDRRVSERNKTEASVEGEKREAC